jgi:hypothetical protein
MMEKFIQPEKPFVIVAGQQPETWTATTRPKMTTTINPVVSGGRFEV